MSSENGNNQAWSLANIGDQSGKIILITGAATGVGFESAKALAAKGATVILACRSLSRADEAAKKILDIVPGAKIESLALDLASLKSVRKAAQDFKARHDRLDVLINNAGIMIPPYSLTEDGFESQFGTNHLGHFAFTGLLLDTLMATPNSRIVNVSSTAHRRGTINFDDLQSKKHYSPFAAYAQSKIANLLFTYELQRRLQKAGSTTIAVAAQPGYALTELQRHGDKNPFFKMISGFIKSFASHSAQDGALAQIRAAVDPSVHANDYFSPAQMFELKGPPVLTQSNERSHDPAVQKKLWTVSEDLTGVTFAV